MLRALIRSASRGRRSAALSILIFHRVLPEPDPLFPEEPTAARFSEICAWIRQWFEILPLDQAVQRLSRGDLPAGAAAITFDDGYADNHDVAMPILRTYGLTATFFVATGYLNGGRMWNDTLIESIRRTSMPELDLVGLLPDEGPSLPSKVPVESFKDKRRLIDRLLPYIKYLPLEDRMAVVGRIARQARAKLPTDLMMTSAQVLALRRAGMGVGAHTVRHPILAGMEIDSARAEIAESRDQLETLIGERVSLFAYPNGKPGTDYDSSTVELVRELGFDAAVSTGWGAARADADLFQLPRFTPWDRDRMPFAIRMLRNLRAPLEVVS